MIRDFNCQNTECDADLEAEVTITSRGHPGQTSGPPEYCYPGEGAEWEVEAVVCEHCGTLHTVDWLTERLEEAVQEAAAEPDDHDYEAPDE